METILENRAFGGVQGVYRHRSPATGDEMTFVASVMEDHVRFHGERL